MANKGLRREWACERVVVRPKWRAPSSASNQWSTLGMETGDTLGLSVLRVKGRRWFTASEGLVKVVRLVKLLRVESSITIKQWVNTPEAAPPCHQRVRVIWTRLIPMGEVSAPMRKDEAFYRIIGGPLTINFTNMFLRALVGAKHDFVVPDDELQELAGFV
ncbi:hypothetical protein SEUCBS139899_008604 [Sporothrix eucalyptigena]